METIKIIVALRSARTALGWTQQEFADKMGAAKSTIARIETMEVSAKADFLMQALRLFRESGIQVELLESDKVVITVEMAGLQEAQSRLTNEQMRRSDRKGVHKPLPKGIFDPAVPNPDLPPAEDDRYGLAA